MVVTKLKTDEKPLITKDEEIGPPVDTNRSVKIKIAVISIILGLLLNWISMFLSITLGFLSIGISVFFVLLIAKFLLGKQATRQNLAIVSIAYGATAAAESSVSLLFLIWLSQNAQAFGLSGEFPSWLLPSASVIASKNLLSPEWLVPLLVHYFLMLIPGFAGIILGLYLKKRYTTDDKKYPWPSVVQRSHIVDVLVTNQSEKASLFKKFLAIGFIFAFVTLFFPVLDISQPQDGWILGLSLGVIGIALFAVGFIIDNWKITVTATISSVIVYFFLAPFIVKDSYLEAVAAGSAGTGYFDFYTFALQSVFISFLVGFLLSAAMISPIVWNIGKKVINKIKKPESKETESKNGEKQQVTVTGEQEADVGDFTDNNEDVKSKRSFSDKIKSIRLTRKDGYFLLLYAVIYCLSVLFVYYIGVLGTNLLLIAAVMFWILVIGSIAIGIITTDSIAKTSAAMSPPFIFDLIPLFLAGARGFVPYIATPKGEVRETTSIASNAKFSLQQDISTKTMIIAYLTGYLPAMITTPFFALLLFGAFGIGTTQLPAPAFPVSAVLIAPFAAGSIEAVLNLVEILLGIVLAIIAGPGMGIGLAFGMFFPPHMALAIGFGGITRIVMNKRIGKEKVRDKGTTAATALSVGASLVVPLMIVMSLLGL